MKREGRQVERFVFLSSGSLVELVDVWVRVEESRKGSLDVGDSSRTDEEL